MRTEYSVVISRDEDNHFDDVLTKIQVEGQLVDTDTGTCTYRINLSKYELLGLRLLCKSGKIRPVRSLT